MKLVIQIPCFNEEQTLPLVFEKMPERIEGIDCIEYQVIDDGSTDRTVEVAKQLGVHHIVQVSGKNRRWLGRAFKRGIDNALALGADIVVNTDGDNQYPSERIADLVRPIVDGYADVVIGDRDPSHFKGFSKAKQFLQKLGSATVGFLTGQPVKDAVSGFRAYSRSALLRIHVMTNYTYTVDTLMQAHQKGLEVVWLPISPNEKTRESRLITSSISKVRKSGLTILRLSTMHSPAKTFAVLSALFALPALGLLGRFGYFYLFVPAEADGHIQSVVVGGVLLVIAFQLLFLGIIGDLLAVNRALIEDLLTRTRKLELQAGGEASAQQRNEDIRLVSNQQ